MAGAHHQPDARVLGLEPMQHRGQDVGAHRRRGPDLQLPRSPGAHLLDRLAPPVHRRQGVLGVRQEGATRLGQPAAVAAAHQQRHAQVALQRLEPGGHRRLGHEQRFRRLGDGPRACHLDERVEAAEVHRLRLR